MFKSRLLAVPVIALALAVVGCGGGAQKKAIEEAQQRVNEFEAKGVPPSELSMAKVHLNNARDDFDKRNRVEVRRHLESLTGELDNAQKFFEERVALIPSRIDAAKTALTAAKAELTGFQARKIDSIFVVIDSLMKINRPVIADGVSQEWLGRIPALQEDERKGVSIRRTLPGTWTFDDKVESVNIDPREAAVERKEYTFTRDGRATILERKKGVTEPGFKIDYEFRSRGTYGLKGDTIMIQVAQFQAVRQMFERFNADENKWEVTQGETYDSLITDGSQDRFITHPDLLMDFSKRR